MIPCSTPSSKGFYFLLLLILSFPFISCKETKKEKLTSETFPSCEFSRQYYLKAVEFASYTDSLKEKISLEIQESQMESSPIQSALQYPSWSEWQQEVFPPHPLSATDSILAISNAVYQTLPYGWMHTEQVDFFSADVAEQYEIITNGYSGNCFQFSLFAANLGNYFKIPSIVLTISLQDPPRPPLKHVIPLTRMTYEGEDRWVPYDPTMGIVWVDADSLGADFFQIRKTLEATGEPVSFRSLEESKGLFCTPGTCLAPELCWPYQKSQSKLFPWPGAGAKKVPCEVGSFIHFRGFL